LKGIALFIFIVCEAGFEFAFEICVAQLALGVCSVRREGDAEFRRHFSLLEIGKKLTVRRDVYDSKKWGKMG